MTLKRTLVALLALFASATLALADWVADTADDGAYFYGTARVDNTSLALRCNGPSARGLPPMSVGAHEETVVPPFQVVFNLGSDLVPVPANGFQRSDIVIWANGTGFRLPKAGYNELNGAGWESFVSMTDPLVLSMLQGSDIVLGAEAGPHFTVPTVNLQQALYAAFGFCIAQYQRMGLAVPPVLAPLAASVPAPQPAIRSAGEIAHDRIARGCNAPYTTEGNPVLYGDLDGDGTGDAVIDWGRVRCQTSMPRPFCGASMCSAEILLSARNWRPYDLLALGVGLTPLSNGQTGVAVGGSLVECNHAGKGNNGCQFIWYWNGTDMVQLK